MNDLMIVLGPPGADDLKDDISEWASNAGETEENIYLEYGQDVLRSLTERSDDDRSGVDQIVSSVLGENVTVIDPFITYCLQGAASYPALIIDLEKIVDEDGQIVANDVLDPDLCDTIGAFFGQLVKTEWVRTFRLHGR
jgi:hypothetical protein